MMATVKNDPVQEKQITDNVPPSIPYGDAPDRPHRAATPYVMKLLAAMIVAIVITLGVAGATEVWELPEDPEQNWVQVTAPQTTTTTVVATSTAPVTTTVTATTVTPTTIPVTTTTVAHTHTVALVDERACVMIPIHTDADGFVYLGPESEQVHTGGLAKGDIRASMVGHFLNIAFGQSNVDSWDMILSSIDVTDIDKVTICE